MTGTFQPSGYITEKSHWNGSPINVFDRDDTTIWECPGVEDVWICYELPEQKTVYWIKLVIASWGEGTGYDYWGRPHHFEIQASNDGENWTVIYEHNEKIDENKNSIEFGINDPKPYTYYRFWQYNTDGSWSWDPNYTLLKQMYLYTINQDTNVYQIATPIMTSDTSDGCEVTASSVSGNRYPYLSFNQQVNAGWYSANAFSTQTPWIQFKFQNGIKKNIKKLRFWNEGNVKQFMLQGSNDGENYTDLGTFDMRHTEQYYNQIFYINSPNSYQYYRITVTDAFNISTTCGIARIDMFEVV